MSISFTNGNPGGKPPMGAPSLPGGKKPEEKKPPAQIQRLEKQQKMVTDKLERAKKQLGLAKKVASAYTVQAAIGDTNPNDDPNEVFEQARPILSKMNLANLADKGKTELVLGKTRGTDSYYKIVLRRNAVIDGDKIDRIKRNEKNFEMIEWTAESMCLYIWYPYKGAEATGPTTPPGR